MTDEPTFGTPDRPGRPRDLGELGDELVEGRKLLRRRRRQALAGVGVGGAIAVFSIGMAWIWRDEPSQLVTAEPTDSIETDSTAAPPVSVSPEVDPALLCSTFEPDPPPTDGPLSDDPDVAAAQQGRAKWGLPSDEASTRAAAADPVDPSTLADDPVFDLVNGVGFPVAAAEVEQLRPSGILDPDSEQREVLSAYTQSHPETFAYRRLDRAAGVIEVAFSDRVEEHRAGIAELGITNVRVIEVEYSQAELDVVQRRVSALMESEPNIKATASGNALNRVEVGLGTLDADSVERVLEVVGPDAPVCFEGGDPADAIPPGPQPDGGDGWRLLADQTGAGAALETSVATTAGALNTLWSDLGLDGPIPSVDFATEIVAWFGAGYSGSCPDIRLDGVVVDTPNRTVTADIVQVGGSYQACTSDANPRAYVVALQRDALPPAPFEVRLDDSEPPACCPERNTTVTQEMLDAHARATEPARGNLVEPSALGLVWTVIAVHDGDQLNIREAPDPNAAVLAELPPWSTNFAATDDTDQNEHGTWRRIVIDDQRQGWANARFLVAQPPALDDTDEAEMIDTTEGLVAWARGSSDRPQTWLADQALWVGGIGVSADGPTPWTWIPATDLTLPADWNRQRDFSDGFDILEDFDCGSDCLRSLNEFLRLDSLDETTRSLVDDVPPEGTRGLADGALWRAPESLHRVALDKPNSNADAGPFDWQRVHFVFDWSSGEPLIALIHTHGWTP